MEYKKKNILTLGLLIVFRMMKSIVYSSVRRKTEYVTFAKIICHKTH